jgi:hypothetical protein
VSVLDCIDLPGGIVELTGSGDGTVPFVGQELRIPLKGGTMGITAGLELVLASAMPGGR